MSGVAIDPFETILSGILPYTVPLFFFPFHLWTVYAINMVLMFWATLVHSSVPWSGSGVRRLRGAGDGAPISSEVVMIQS